MSNYRIKIFKDAVTEILQVAKWYDEVRDGLGKRFKTVTINRINTLKKDPFIYAIRYQQIRCLPIPNSPTWFITT